MILGNPSIPSYDSRLSLVKLLLEVSLYTQALFVLETLQKENDQVIDLWYLYGWCYYCMSQCSQEGQSGQDGSLQNLQNQNHNHHNNTDDGDERLTHLEDARDCLITCHKAKFLNFNVFFFYLFFFCADFFSFLPLVMSSIKRRFGFR